MARCAEFFENLFPGAGSWSRLKEVNKQNGGPRKGTVDKNSIGQLVQATSCFTEAQVKHFNDIFEMLGDNQEAKAALAGVLEFTQMKDDVASFG